MYIIVVIWDEPEGHAAGRPKSYIGPFDSAIIAHEWADSHLVFKAYLWQVIPLKSTLEINDL